MPQPKRRRLAEVVGEPLEHALRPEASRGLELELGGTARPDEVRVVRIRQPIRLRARLRDHRSLFEREHGVGGAGEREQRLDRIPALGIGSSVARALHHAERDVEISCDLPEERRRGERRRPELEMRSTSDREGSSAEERPTQVRAPTAPARDDASRRTLERRVPAVDDARCDEDVERARVALHVELEARRAIERAPAVGADLGPDSFVAEQRERPARSCAAPEVEMKAPLPVSAQVEVARGMEERGELRTPVAVACRRDARELLADVLGRDQRDTPSSPSNRRLTATPAEP